MYKRGFKSSLSRLFSLGQKRKKRLGKGIGSGRGKTSTRGQKGQHARNTVSPLFEGGQTPLHRLIPKRGMGKSKSTCFTVNLKDLLNGMQKNNLTTIDSKFILENWKGTRHYKTVKLIHNIKLNDDKPQLSNIKICVDKASEGVMNFIKENNGTIELKAIVSNDTTVKKKKTKEGV